MKSVNIKISNKAVYSLLTIFIIAAVAVSVFAVPNPGHGADEVSGVCKSDGSGCQDYQENLELYVRTSDNKLCYPTEGASSCTLSTETCSQTQGLIVWDDGICSLSSSVQNLMCETECGNVMACDGDDTSFSCGTPGTVYYDTGVVDQCFPSTPANELRCICSVSGTSYAKEIANSERCV